MRLYIDFMLHSYIITVGVLLMEFKDRLRSLRKENDLLQKDVAEKLKIARTTYNGYETGAREPDFTTLKKLANLFDCSIDYIIGVSNIKKSDDLEYLVFINELKEKKIKPSDLKKLLEILSKWKD